MYLFMCVCICRSHVFQFLLSDNGILALFSVKAADKVKINDRMALNQNKGQLYFTYDNKVILV